MSTLPPRLHSAIQCRETGNPEEARRILLELHAEVPEDPQVNYQCAWIHDLLGLEREAIPFYEKAIQNGLDSDDLRGALLGLGSTYRQSIENFQHARKLFPGGQVFEVFLARELL